MVRDRAGAEQWSNRAGRAGLGSQRIVAGEEQTQAALFVERVRPGVRSGELQAIRQPFASLKLERVIAGDSLGSVEHGIHVIADIRDAAWGVAGVFRPGTIWFEIQCPIIAVTPRIQAAIRIDLPVDRTLRRGQQRLIERNRQYFVYAMIADVSDAEEPVIGRLILNVECPIDGVGQLVVGIVAAQQERSEQVARRVVAIEGVVEVRQKSLERGGVLRRRRRHRGAKWRLQGRAFACEYSRDERLLERYPQRSVESKAGAGRKLAEQLAAVVIHADSATHGQLRLGGPRQADARRKAPLVLRQ